MTNILSVDVEEWFHPESLQHLFPKNEWEKCEQRVNKNVNRLLELFEKRNKKATFFILGWLGERYPEMIEAIFKQGHEIASHGYGHRMITKMTPEEFEADLAKSLSIFKGITGTDVIGYRAPTFSLVKETKWAFDIMKKNGIRYDSSVYPVYHDRYGIPNAPRSKYYPLENTKDFIEFPASTIKFFGQNFPFGGGGYLRIFPLWFTRYGFNRLQKENIPGIIYVHPWEFDAEQPRLDLPLVKKWRHYYNINRNLDKLDNLLQNFEWTSFKNYLETHTE